MHAVTSHAVGTYRHFARFTDYVGLAQARPNYVGFLIYIDFQTVG